MYMSQTVSVCSEFTRVRGHEKRCNSAQSKFMCAIIRNVHLLCHRGQYIDGLVQDCSNPIANALELLQSCTKPSIWCLCCIVTSHGGLEWRWWRSTKRTNSLDVICFNLAYCIHCKIFSMDFLNYNVVVGISRRHDAHLTSLQWSKCSHSPLGGIATKPCNKIQCFRNISHEKGTQLHLPTIYSFGAWSEYLFLYQYLSQIMVIWLDFCRLRLVTAPTTPAPPTSIWCIHDISSLVVLQLQNYIQRQWVMMTLSNGNGFRVTSPLRGEPLVTGGFPSQGGHISLLC